MKKTIPFRVKKTFEVRGEIAKKFNNKFEGSLKTLLDMALSAEENNLFWFPRLLNLLLSPVERLFRQSVVTTNTIKGRVPSTTCFRPKNDDLKHTFSESASNSE